MPQQLEYDEQGSTFYYFLISFYVLFLLPATYFLWPSRKKAAGEAGLVCQCDPCRHKRVRLEEEQPRETLWIITRVAIIAVLWLLLLFMLYKVLTAEVGYEEYDPFSILELDSDATMAEIKKQYRRLSKVYHPDKQGGDQDMFMKIAKAYEALTDEVSRENWIKYGNPDGPQAATFGIALPSWVVEKQNSIWVLGLYMLVFIVILPIAVGTWWYRSIKYTTANLLIQTTQVFFHFLSKPRQLTIKRLLMVMTAAFEFNPQYSKLLLPRPSDDEELSELIHSKDLPHLTVKVKEPVLREPWAIKACILIHAHFGKVPLPPATLRPDQRTVLKLCPRLVNEMISILNQVWIYARYRPSPQVSTAPSQDVYESVMKMSQMIVQQMWERQSVMLQLPHIQTDMLRHFRTRRRNITTVEEFVAMKNEDRRSLVRALSDEDYLDVMAVCSSFPHISISTETQVMDDDDRHKVTAGSMVTVTVTLRRVGLLQRYNVDPESLLGAGTVSLEEEEDPLINHNTSQAVENVGAGEKSKPQRPSWEKNKKKKKGKTGGGGKTVRRRPGKKGKDSKEKKEKEPEEQEEVVEEKRGSVSEEEVEERESGGEGEGEEGGREEADEEEEEWQSLQETMKVQQQKKKELGANKESHPVHAPFFPEVKQEGWWLYIADKRRKDIVVLPQKVQGLKSELTQDLQFQAPDKPCVLRYTVFLTSDSYLNLQFSTDLKIDVSQRVEVKGRSQWAELEQEEEEEEAFEETDSGGDVSEESDSDS